MANINVSELKPVGSDLFIDSDSFINDLMSEEFEQVLGGVDLTLPYPMIRSVDFGACLSVLPWCPN
ncbi:MAG: hypothetical protein QNJ47_00715 [Nostocaceae cyanobacterium]|nr:hypothetical protein [Nostocaceae cyanobacterium]